MPPASFTQVGRLKTIEDFRNYLAGLDLELPVDDRILRGDEGSPMAEPLTIPASAAAAGGGSGQDGRRPSFTIGNRWCIHPMEGWDGTADGKPSEPTTRRWQRFGQSGAKLIWGGEAFAVQQDGRANPNQLYYAPENVAPLKGLLDELVSTHENCFGRSDDLLVGLQLTHSGRFCRPNRMDRLEPLIAYHHPLLDARFGIDPNDDSVVVSDDWLKRLIDQYILVAKMAAEIGFRFVDIKHCHGYLGHELLSGFDRPGEFGGSFENRTRFMRQIVEGIRAECPELLIGVRLSVFDQPPYNPDPAGATPGKLGPGIPDDWSKAKPYPGFGCRRDNPLEPDLEEPVQLLEMMRDDLKVDMVNLSAGSPYYNPHIQRPAYYPPSDGYQPPEDPTVGCVRQIQIVRELHRRVPGLVKVGTAYTYFQEWLPQVAQAVMREDWVDVIGIGRMVLAYPEVPADSLEHGQLRNPKLLCRTFSDCTTAPRNGLVSGCYPLDDYYKNAPEHKDLKQAKAALREKLKVLNSPE